MEQGREFPSFWIESSLPSTQVRPVAQSPSNTERTESNEFESPPVQVVAWKVSPVPVTEYQTPFAERSLHVFTSASPVAPTVVPSTDAGKVNISALVQMSLSGTVMAETSRVKFPEIPKP